MSDKKTAASLSAIKQYISKSDKNGYKHKASILICTNKEDFGFGTRLVCAFVERELGKVIIEDLHTLYSCCPNMFTTQNSSFAFISNTLCINYKDPTLGEININLTKV